MPLWEEIMLHFEYFLSVWGTETGKELIAQKVLLIAENCPFLWFFVLFEGFDKKNSQFTAINNLF